MDLNRRDELAANLADVRARIAAAARAAGRNSDDVHLIAVTKTWPLSDVQLLYDLGLREFGESRDQEARPKAEEWQRIDGRPITWHFIGQLQSNKAKSVVTYASVIHTVDRASLVDALLRTGAERDCLLQLSVDGDPDRGGVPLPQALELARRIVAPLRLRGVMSVAPLDMDPAVAFAAVADTHEQLLTEFPEATIRCIGMSEDVEFAIAAGATHVRVGSALLGKRPPAH